MLPPEVCQARSISRHSGHQATFGFARRLAPLRSRGLDVARCGKPKTNILTQGGPEMDSYDAEEEQNEKKAPPVGILAVPFIPVIVALIEHGPEWIEKLQLLGLF